MSNLRVFANTDTNRHPLLLRAMTGHGIAATRAACSVTARVCCKTDLGLTPTPPPPPTPTTMLTLPLAACARSLPGSYQAADLLHPQQGGVRGGGGHVSDYQSLPGFRPGSARWRLAESSWPRLPTATKLPGGGARLSGWAGLPGDLPIYYSALT